MCEMDRDALKALVERTPDEAVAKAVDARATYLIREYTRDESLYDEYHYRWETKPAPASNPLGGACWAKLPDGGKLMTSVHWLGGRYHAHVLRFDAQGRRMWSTERPEDWGAIEEVYPRAARRGTRLRWRRARYARCSRLTMLR